MKTKFKASIAFRKGRYLKCLCLALAMVCYSSLTRGQVKIYQAPKGKVMSTDYIVEVNGKQVPVYPAITQHHDKKYALAYFDFAGKVTVKIKSKIPMSNFALQPAKYGVVPIVKDDQITFTLDRPLDLSIEPDGQNSPLLLFCNAPEHNAPKPNDPGVVYFGPGVHNPKGGLIKLTSGQTLYIAGGAVVNAGVDASGDNIKIMGRGILDGSDWVHNAGPNDFMVNATDCNNLLMKDIIVQGSYYWTIVPQRCDRVLIDHIRLAGSRVGNDDGVDPCNSSNITIRNCFFRTDDDSISPKGTTRAGGEAISRPCENILVENCTFWVDFANVFRIATESSCPGVRNFTARNIDVIHFPDRKPVQVFYLHPTGAMPMENFLFEDIRINGATKLNLVKLTPMLQLVGTRPIEVPRSNNIESGPGRRGQGGRGYGEFVVVPANGPFIHNVIFRNIEVYGKESEPGSVLIQGVNDKQDVSGIVFENVTRYGQPLTATSPGVKIGEYVNNLKFNNDK